MSDTQKEVTQDPKKEAHTFCIIQLSRYGDLIQTYQAAAELKLEHPNIRLVLVARKKFAEPLDFILKKVFSKIYLLDPPSFFETKDEYNLENVKNNIRYFLNEIHCEKIFVTINLTFSKTSAYLNSLIKSENKLGLARDNPHQFLINDNWSKFIYSNVMGGPLNPFNLVDLFKNMFGTNANSYKNLKTISPESGILIFHPFASQEKKRWNLNNWSEVMYLVLRDVPKSKIYIIGSPEEYKESMEIINNPILSKYKQRILNLTGTKPISELAEYFVKGQLFVGHDSMCGHLASLYGVQTVTISLGTVRPDETTPYGAANVNLSPKTKCFPCFPNDKCDDFKCHNDLQPQAVGEVIKSLITDENLRQVDKFNFEALNIYVSEINDNGFRLTQVNSEIDDMPYIFKNYYRTLWNYLISEKEENIACPTINEDEASFLTKYLEGIEHIFELNDFGKKYSSYIIQEYEDTTPNITNIQDYTKRLKEIDELTLVLKKSYPYLSPVVDYFHVSKANVAGSNIAEMSANMLLTYQQFNNANSIIYELIQSTLKNFRANYSPQLVKSNIQESNN